MNEVDDAVLEYFEVQEEGAALPPTVVWWNLAERLEALDKSRDTVARRMRDNLTARGLLEVADEKRGYYQITQKGRDYLAGELNADDLEENEPV